MIGVFQVIPLYPCRARGTPPRCLLAQFTRVRRFEERRARHRLRALLAVLLLAAVFVPAAKAAQPNVVFILTDDQRWDELGYMPTVESELVGKGVTFTNAFAVNPVCCPSRSSILTGRWSHSTGVWGIDGAYGGFHVFDDSSTLPVWLRQAGYHTGLVGKYLNGYTDGSYKPPGWDEWFAHTTHANAYFGWEATDGTNSFSFGNAEADYNTDVLAARAEEFIRTAGPEPFFLYFAPKAPHIDRGAHVTAAPRHTNAYAGVGAWRPPSFNETAVRDKPAYIRGKQPESAARVDAWRQEALDSLLAVDDAVGRLLTALQDTGRLENTLIIFMSDNGFTWGEHRFAWKVTPYEESIRVPLVVRWDALGIPARREGRFALNVDIAPTIAAAAGAATPGVEGRNLLPLVDGSAAGWRTRFLIEDRMGYRVPGYCGYRTRGWKYVQYDTGEEELYNLRVDPYELRSQHRRARARVMRFRAAVRHSPCRPPGLSPLPSCTIMGSNHADRLRGGRRRDWVCARGGRDRINVRWGGRDVVRCGPGVDHVRADRRDRLIGCERRTRL